MEVGKEFSSWESFQNALDMYSKDNKVVYIVGTCKPVESANKNESLQYKFPSKFKYCFARMLCKHFGNYTSQSLGQRPHQRTCKTGCTSSILVSVNRKRTALVIKEANLQHTHEVSELIFSKYSQNRRLQGEERRMATILLRAGVPLSRVQEFISNSCSKSPTVKDLQNIKTAMKGSLCENEGHEFEFLTDLDQIMSEDSEAIIEIINFNLVPGAIYIQTSDMVKRTKLFKEGQLQIITQLINDGKMSVVSIIGVGGELNPHTLAFCIIVVGGITAFEYLLETFVKNNQVFCDSITGVVLDCPKEQADFLVQLVPQADVAWSKSYILKKISDELEGKQNRQECLVLQSDMMSANSKKIYEDKLKELLNTKDSIEGKEFLKTWDSCKELWVQFELTSRERLHHQRAALELAYVKNLKAFIKPNMGLSDLIKALLKYDKSEDPGAFSKELNTSSLHQSCEQYRQLCFPDASQAIASQIAIALSSVYSIKVAADMIFIRRHDSDDEYILDTSGTKCTCRHYIDTDLPCQHIFAWLNHTNKPLFSESLVPIRFQVFGSAITLDALANSLAQGQVPSSFHHDERLKELQGILKDVLRLCCSHSYEQMGKDLVLLKQILMVMKNCSSQKTKVVTEEEETNKHNDQQPPPVLPRRRGRPSKKDKLLQKQPVPQQQPSVENLLMPRHNLRTNIKHKFVTREIHRDVKDNTNEAPMKKPKESDTNHETPSSHHSQASDIQAAKTEETAMSDIGGNKIINFKEKTSPQKNRRSVSKVNSLLHKEDIRHTFQNESNVNSTPQTKSKSDFEDDMSCEEDEYEENEEIDDAEEHDQTVENDRVEQEAENQENFLQKLKDFLKNVTQESLVSLLNTVSMMTSDEQKAKYEKSGLTLGSISPVDGLLNMCKNETLSSMIVDNLRQLPFTYSKLVYQVSAALIQRSVSTSVPISELTQTISYWPSHLPDLPYFRSLDGELSLNEGQVLRLGSYKVDQADMDTLRSGLEINTKVLHAYLEILAQKYSGKIFIIPFDVVLSWRSGNYSDRIFKKVHFKTFDFIILPINCGAEFSLSERQSGDIPEPSWMALVADIRDKTVGILNPKIDDKYAIAANGYMLQWRRYIQIRSIHTGEMLCTWSTKQIECSKIEDNRLSGVHLLMNVEALVSNVPPMVMTQSHVHNYLKLIAVALRDTDRETTVLCVGGPECQVLAARDADWLQCENCRTWWHRACADQGNTKPVFYCNSCHQRILAVKGKIPEASAQPGEFIDEDSQPTINGLDRVGETGLTDAEQTEENEVHMDP
ncbi:hypothetical protein Btru_001695 [Bulinus truncatus]|nr:hypothetical protein Btru_001695 [Bulinus truncatus]